VVVVRGHAVPAVAVEIEAHAVEGRARSGDDVLARLIEGARRLEREMEVCGQARHVHVAVVHPSALGLPGHHGAQLGEPGLGDRRVHETRRIGDPPAHVVDEHGLGGFEE
jgi:hypothetical protein